MAFATRFAIAAIHDPSVLSQLESILEGWMNTVSSQGCRPAYQSNLVVIQRIVALFWTGLIVAANLSKTSTSVLHSLARIIASDIEFLRPRLGSSVANNHLLADRFGEWFIFSLVHERNSRADERIVTELAFAQELCRQSHEDGTSFEHSSHYHEVAVEMASFYVFFSRAQGCSVRPDVANRLRKMLEFQTAIAGNQDTIFAFGNAVEDPILPLDDDNQWGAGSWRLLLSQPSRSQAKLTTDTTHQRAFWLSALSANEPLKSADVIDQSTPPIQCFDDGGFVVIDDDLSDIHLVFRTGPSPDSEIYGGHMHSDLLSLVASHHGHPVLVDPGTYSYRLNESDPVVWRRYFAGPDAHNGPCLRMRRSARRITN